MLHVYKYYGAFDVHAYMRHVCSVHANHNNNTSEYAFKRNARKYSAYIYTRCIIVTLYKTVNIFVSLCVHHDQWIFHKRAVFIPANTIQYPYIMYNI